MGIRIWVSLCALVCGAAFASCGDPQLRTEHPWYPGELSCSTFERLFKTQTELYKRVTGRETNTEEDKALAAWYWRNLHYTHSECGAPDLFGTGFLTSEKREYWCGLFGNGMGLCGATHAQFSAEIERLLGPSRSRQVGVSGHNSFEVWLTGGAYGEGRWALLDSDISTVIFSADGSRLLSIPEIKADLQNLGNPAYKPERQRGWRVAGLYDGDCGVFEAFGVAEYAPGYAGPPPMVHLRAGETLRRYLKPGLEDGKTFVYWGRNYKAGGIPGPQRDRTWVNQPEKMYNSKTGSGQIVGQARYGNAVYTYTPDFKSGTYKEGLIDEGEKHVTLEFTTPFVICCTPGNEKDWGIYDPGAKNGLVLKGKLTCPVKVSVDHGKVWLDGGAGREGLDLTDFVKGYQQYWIRFEAGAAELAGMGLSIRTVCQANQAVMPRLKDGANKITFLASGQALFCAGPTKALALAHAGTPAPAATATSYTLEIAAPRKEKLTRLYAAAWQNSGCPPKPFKYNIEYSADSGTTWIPIVKDRVIERREPDPPDHWSQSMSFGDVPLDDAAGPLKVRFRNNGGRTYRKVEANVAYKVEKSGPVEATFAWSDGKGPLKTASHTYPAKPGETDATWTLDAGQNVTTHWVEFAAK